MMQLPMRGLRINRHRDGLTVAQGRLEERLTMDLNLRCDGVSPDGPSPDASSPWQEALEPPGLSDFSRFFGPLMPDILERRWLLCEQDMPLIHTALGMLEGTAQGERTWRQLRASTLASGDGWRFVAGDFLVRVANHLSEHDLQFYGVPAHRWEDVPQVFDPEASTAAVAHVVEARCDLSMAAYEGIWAAFFGSPPSLDADFFTLQRALCRLRNRRGIGARGRLVEPLPSLVPLSEHRPLVERPSNPMSVLQKHWSLGLAVAALLALASCAPRSAGTLTPNDERTLLRMAWEEAIEERKLPGLQNLEASPPVVLRADPRWSDLDLSSLPAVEFLDHDALKRRAAASGTFQYLSFRCCTVQPDGNTVRVTLQVGYARTPDVEGIPMGGGGMFLTAERGVWGWKIVESQAVIF